MKCLKIVSLCALCYLQPNLAQEMPQIPTKKSLQEISKDSSQNLESSNEANNQKSLESFAESAKSDEADTKDSLESQNKTQDLTQNQIQNQTIATPSSTTQSTALAKPTILSLLYNAGFDFLLDNTENTKSLWWDTRTRYALRLSGEIGLLIFDFHRIFLGGYGLQDMGQKRVFNAGGGIYAYYAYGREREIGTFGGTFGIFPRKKLLKIYPRSFFRDDFLFLSPASNGALLQYSSPKERDIKGKAEIVFDWFGGNLAKRDDEFFLLFGSEVSFFDSLNLGLDALVFHFKNSDVLGKGESVANDVHLLDRILYNGYVEVDFRGFVPSFKKYLDKAQIGFSALGQIERKRRLSGNEPFYIGAGYEAGFKAQYKGFGIEESYYFGKPQMRYFGQYGEQLYEGLPLYQREFNRVNAYYLYKNKFLRTQISLIFYTFGRQLATQQMLTFSIDTDKITKPKVLR